MRHKFCRVLILVAITLLAHLMHSAEAAAPASARLPLSNCGSAYTVRSGDTLNAIAARCKVSVTSLMKANGLRSSTIYPGQRLVIPASAGTASPDKSAPTASCANPYTVRSGDTLGLIASRCGVSITELRRLNDLTGDTIWPNQKLRLKNGAPTSPRPAPLQQYRIELTPPPSPTPQIESPISLW